jgi:hypothetical protein
MSMGRRDEPPEREFPEGLYEKFAVEVMLNKDTGNYVIRCQEWRCEFPGGPWPGGRVAKLVDEIVAHNRAERSE